MAVLSEPQHTNAHYMKPRTERRDRILAQRKLRASAVLCTLLCMTACLFGGGEDYGPCHPELKNGEKLRVTLLEEWNQGSQFQVVNTSSSQGFYGCGYKPELAAGTTLQIQLVGNSESGRAGCDDRLATFALDGVTLEGGPFGLSGQGDALVQASNRASFPDGCSGGWEAALILPRGSRGIFAAAIPGEVPPVALVRNFYPDKNAPCAAAPEVAYTCLFAATAERQ